MPELMQHADAAHQTIQMAILLHDLQDLPASMLQMLFDVLRPRELLLSPASHCPVPYSMATNERPET
ncbi:hypothetical protein D3C74_190410 [compost metagenome]